MLKVSVIIPTYNRAHYIQDALDSIFAQSYINYEIIVVDDGSTDNTKDVLSPYLEKIIYIYQENKGISGARNTGIQKAKGEYIAFLDSDDVWFPNKLESQIALLERAPHISLVFSDVFAFSNSSDKKISYFDKVKPCRGYIAEQLFLENFICTITVVMRRKCILKSGYFDENLSYAEDYDFWLRVSRDNEIDYINTALAKFRMHDGKQTVIIGETNQYVDRIRVLEDFLNNNSVIRKRLGVKANKRISSVYFILGCSLLKKDNCREAQKAFLSSINKYPLGCKKYILLLLTIHPFKSISKLKGFILSRYFGC